MLFYQKSYGDDKAKYLFVLYLSCPILNDEKRGWLRDCILDASLNLCLAGRIEGKYANFKLSKWPLRAECGTRAARCPAAQ